jgi:hypothetical protein
MNGNAVCQPHGSKDLSDTPRPDDELQKQAALEKYSKLHEYLHGATTRALVRHVVANGFGQLQRGHVGAQGHLADAVAVEVKLVVDEVHEMLFHLMYVYV